MALIHVVVDYSFLYYKYKFQLESGRMKRLTTPMNWKGTVIEKDISQIYYSIKEIEGFRRKWEQIGHDVFVSVCFDMPSDRKQKTDESGEAATKYKSNRTKKLNEDDFENIQFVERLLSQAGYNTYRFERYEADDIVAHLVNKYKDTFDVTLVYTPDADMLVHVQPKVGVCRYKTKRGYSNVDVSNFEDYISEEMKCYIPFNGLMLYKCTVGDKSDCIDGIKKFGPSAFTKLVEHLNENYGIVWSMMNKYGNVEITLEQLRDDGYFTKEQFKQAQESLSLVRPMQFEDGVVADPIKHSTRELRSAAYSPYNMNSLID